MRFIDKKREPLEATLWNKLGNNNYCKHMLSYPTSVSQDYKHIAANFMRMKNYVKGRGSFGQMRGERGTIVTGT